MITRDIPIRVRYYETDCMGFVHHSNYVRYYETARTEMLRELGMTYPELEAQGIMLPVIDVQSRYVSPACASMTRFSAKTGNGSIRAR